MVKENKTIEGQIIEKTIDSIKIRSGDKYLWIKFFDNELIRNIQTSEIYKVEYVDNIKNGKTYHNGKSVQLINEVNIHKKNVSDTSINCILMQSVQHSLNKQLELGIATIQVIESYKKIIDSL